MNKSPEWRSAEGKEEESRLWLIQHEESARALVELHQAPVTGRVGDLRLAATLRRARQFDVIRRVHPVFPHEVFDNHVFPRPEWL